MTRAHIFVLFGLVMYASATCDISPRHWCDSKEIAVSCNVEAACMDRLWKVNEPKPVNISLYFESLCPGCRQFIVSQFYPTWKALKSSGIIKGEVFPYGNAHEVEISSGFYNYTCQHGPEECTGNLIENCLLKYTRYHFDVYFPIIHCMESSNDPIVAAEKCITDGHQDWTTINKCAKGKEGNSLMHKTALRTGALNPKHKYVPWILVNGVHTESLQQEAQTDLLKVVCDTYTGPKPKECPSVSADVCIYE